MIHYSVFGSMIGDYLFKKIGRDMREREREKERERDETEECLEKVCLNMQLKRETVRNRETARDRNRHTHTQRERE